MPQFNTRAGYLRHRLTFQDKSVTQNSYGEEEITWTTTNTVWGSLEPLRGREYLEGRQEQANISHRVRVRYGITVKPSMRITHNSRTFEIVAPAQVEPFEKPQFMTIMVREEVDT